MHATKRSAKKWLALALMPLLGACIWDGNNGGEVAQGWSLEQRFSWHWATQGSRLIPEVWFDALEQANNTTAFSDMSNLTGFGFLNPDEGDANGDSIRPIGFARDRQSDVNLKVTSLRWYDGQAGDEDSAEPWIGLNCSACHTARFTYQGQATTIEGGPNLLDFQSFVEALDSAVVATVNDPQKWDRFSAKVLGSKDTPQNREKLAAATEQYVQWQAKTAAMNRTKVRYGFGRLDAVGHILNKILMFADAGSREGNPSNAPVSYPFLWGISDQEHVQWNGIARNSRFTLPGGELEYGALGRNTGEVLGVFGDLKLVPGEGVAALVKGYKSSVSIDNLAKMEDLVKALKAPKWPDTFPAIDEVLAGRGEEIFAEKCVSCHTEPQASPTSEPTERMITFEDTLNLNKENLTDIWMACNAFVYSGPTGPLKGTKDTSGKRLAEIEPVIRMLEVSVRGAILEKKSDLLAIVFRTFFGIPALPTVVQAEDPFNPRSVDQAICLTSKDNPILGYKARPLDGIWATAPYLHNGSVASLYELLLPPEKRLKEFWVGNREFDPVKVGYSTVGPGEGQGFLLKTVAADGRPIPGNSNQGHVYGAGSMSDADRMALVEYLKSQ